MKHTLAVVLLFLAAYPYAQAPTTYQTPPQEILDLVDVPRAPGVLLDDRQENMVLLYRDAYQSIEDLSKEELRLGGLRIDPKTNIGDVIKRI